MNSQIRDYSQIKQLLEVVTSPKHLSEQLEYLEKDYIQLLLVTDTREMPLIYEAEVIYFLRELRLAIAAAEK